ncbi:MAG: iviTM7 [Candidatus Saccharibacteria bacterium]|nr:iviTM7 [Candidatus Saccharibacteria bacterium]
MPRRTKSTPHHPFRFASNCDQKRRFDTEKKARDAAEYQMLIKPELELDVYKCELCGGWHLTRQKPLV